MKHKLYIRRCRKNVFNFAEGAVRAGKTIDNVTAFVYELETTPDRIHLATGSTIANAKLNIGDANGFGLEYQFRGRCHWGKYKGNECLYIKTKTGLKVVIFAGGAKSDSYKKIRGNSYGMWIATEINLHHDNTIKEAFNRQLAAKRRKIFWDLNPDNPNAPIYTEYIDAYRRKSAAGELIGGCNYEHFTIFDNVNISQENRQSFISQYDPETIWYKRDILGLRCVAEGLIYRQFAEQTKDFIINSAEKYLAATKQQVGALMIGIDFGGTGSATTFVAVLITKNYREAIAIAEFYDKSDIDPDKLNQKFIDFIKQITKKWGIGQVRADSAEQILIRGLYNTALKKNLPIEIKNAMKLPINDRIRLENLLIAQGRFKVCQNCSYLINALSTAVFDAKKIGETIRLDDGTTNIDSLDALEYALEPHARGLEQAWFLRKEEGLLSQLQSI